MRREAAVPSGSPIMDNKSLRPHNALLEVLQVACPAAIAVVFATLPTVRLLFTTKSKRRSYSTTKAARARLEWASPAVCITFVSANSLSRHGEPRSVLMV